MKHFTIAELTYSATAKEKKIKNVPSPLEKENLIKLVDNVLDPIREKYGKPIHVTSGFRCVKLNELLGGVWNSDHIKGYATDIVGTPNTKAENKKLYKLIRSMDLPVRQCINEKDYEWIHISYNENDIQRQYFGIP